MILIGSFGPPYLMAVFRSNTRSLHNHHFDCGFIEALNWCLMFGLWGCLRPLAAEINKAIMEQWKAVNEASLLQSCGFP